MNDEAIQKILNYKENSLFEPGSHWPKDKIQERAYARCAADEILLSVMDHPFTDPDTIIENFIIKMEYFLHISDDATSNFIFTIAENTAEDILGLIL